MARRTRRSARPRIRPRGRARSGPSRAACRARRRAVLRRRIARMGAARNPPPAVASPSHLVARLEPHDHSAFPTVRFHHGRISRQLEPNGPPRPVARRRFLRRFRLSGSRLGTKRRTVPRSRRRRHRRHRDVRTDGLLPVAMQAAEAHLGVVERASPASRTRFHFRSPFMQTTPTRSPAVNHGVAQDENLSTTASALLLRSLRHGSTSRWASSTSPCASTNAMSRRWRMPAVCTSLHVHAGDEHPSIPAVILHERLASFVSAAHPTPSFGEQLPLDRSERVRNVVRAGEAQHAAALVDPHVLSSFEPQRFVLEARRRTGAARFGRRPHRFVQHARPICLRERERQRAPRNERSHDRPSTPAATGAYRRPAHSSTPGL